MILIFPCMIMILMPWAANLEIKNINLNIVDNGQSQRPFRAALWIQLVHPPNFQYTAFSYRPTKLRSIEIGFGSRGGKFPVILKKKLGDRQEPRLLVARQCGERYKGRIGCFDLLTTIPASSHYQGEVFCCFGFFWHTLPDVACRFVLSLHLSRRYG